MSAFQRNKGKRGERRVIDWLQPLVDEIVQDLGISAVLLQRNTVQSDIGGTDIIGLDWMAAEVKNCACCKQGDIERWWAQAEAQAKQWRKADGTARTPILFYIANRKIRVRLPGAIWHITSMVHHFTPVDIDAENFLIYFVLRTREELTKRAAII